MLSIEKNLRSIETGKTQNFPPLSQIEVAAYIEKLAAELKEISQRSGLVFLSYLLSMVVLQASEFQEHEEEKEERPHPLRER